MKYFVFVIFALTIPTANWLIGNVGTVCIPDGPCLIPVGFGLMAPSGVLMIGVAWTTEGNNPVIVRFHTTNPTGSDVATHNRPVTYPAGKACAAVERLAIVCRPKRV